VDKYEHAYWILVGPVHGYDKLCDWAHEEWPDGVPPDLEYSEAWHEFYKSFVRKWVASSTA
jgi:hypothetical protein